MKERGFAIIGTVVVIALAIALGFGGAVVLGQSHLVSTAKRTQTKLSVRSHESLDVDRNENDVTLRNDGSVSVFLKKVLVERRDGSLDSFDFESHPKTVKVLESSSFNVSKIKVEPEENVGVLTRLGNVFWEAG